MSKLKYLNAVFYVLSSVFILMAMYYLYINIVENRGVVLDNQKKIEQFLTNQKKNRNGIEVNHKLLLEINRKLN